MHFKGRDIVSIDQLSSDEIGYLLDKASGFKQAEKEGRPQINLLTDLVMAYAFFEPSTRTRISFLRAARKQGMDRIGFGSAESTSLKKNESLHDTLEMLVQYEAKVIVIRNSHDGAAQYAADLFDIPVINAGDGSHEHPTQTLLDLMTVKEAVGRLDHLRIGMGGDLKYGRVAHSDIKAFRRYEGNKFIFVNPPLLNTPPDLLVQNDWEQYTDLQQALNNCDVFFVFRVQKERIQDEREREEVLGKFTIRPEMIDAGRSRPIILHPLPIDADHPEIDKTFYRERPAHAWYYRQSGNGLFVREALLCALLGRIGEDFAGKGFVPPEYSRQNSFIQLEVGEQGQKDSHFILSINDGVVIDHIPAGQGHVLYDLLQLDRFEGRKILASGLASRREGTKDLIKLVGYSLPDHALSTIGIVCPNSTVNIIANGKVSEKYQVQLPDRIDGLIQCDNRNCISRNPREDAPGIFYTKSRNPVALACHYCDTVHSPEKRNIKFAL